MASLKTRFLRVFLFMSFLPTIAGIRPEHKGFNTPLSGQPSGSQAGLLRTLAPEHSPRFRSREMYAIDPALSWNTFLGENNGTDYGFGVTVDRSGGIYVTGISNEAWGTPVRDFTAASDAFVAKLDPSGNLIWNTFLGGGASNDYGEEIVLDASGNVYVTGLTDAGVGSGTWGSPIRPFTGQGDAFVAKLDSSGRLLWNTFLGSSVTDWGKGLVVAPDGNLYVTGFSAAAWGSPIVRPFTAIDDAFVAKLDSSGNLIWTSFFGGIGFDQASGITSDVSGTLYLAGFSTATVGSASWGNPVRDYTTGGDAFVASLNADGNLTWNTFLGGNGYEFGTEAAVDRTGNIVVTGLSNAFWGNPVRDYTAGNDAFAVSLDSRGNLLWNTFLGGSGFDEGYGIDADGTGNVYVAGTSTAAWGAPQRGYTALDDAFAVKLDSDGNLVSNTFLGGSGTDFGNGLDVDQNGNPYVTGSSTAAWGTPVSDYTPPTDAFVVGFASPPLVVSTSLRATMDHGPGSFTVTFSKDVNNPPGSSNVDDATNPNNYLLIEKGTNASADTTSCAAGVNADDRQITVMNVTYNATTRTSTVTLTEPLRAGRYRLIVCGTTSIVDLAGTALAGNGVTSGTDYNFDFVVNTISGTGVSLPETGFAPHRVTALSSQPADRAYSSLGDLWLEIPTQNVRSNIVGVPGSDQGWDVTWLGDNIGWLNGTTFPSWTGNSVLTGHVYSSNGLPGPFMNIKNLKYGDTIIIHVYGEKYIFAVQSTRLSHSTATEFALRHLEDRSYLTLITCQGYNPLNDSYLFRRIVRAVLVDVELE